MDIYSAGTSGDYVFLNQLTAYQTSRHLPFVICIGQVSGAMQKRCSFSLQKKLPFALDEQMYQRGRVRKGLHVICRPQHLHCFPSFLLSSQLVLLPWRLPSPPTLEQRPPLEGRNSILKKESLVGSWQNESSPAICHYWECLISVS